MTSMAEQFADQPGFRCVALNLLAGARKRATFLEFCSDYLNGNLAAWIMGCP